MPGYNPLTLNFDQSLLSPVAMTNGTGSQTTYVTPSFYRNDEYLLTLQVYTDSSVAAKANLASINTSSLVLNVGLVGVSPVITINSSKFDASNAATGLLTCQINTHSSALTTALGTSSQKSYTLDVIGKDNSIGSTQHIALTPIIAVNVVGTGS